jgi:hypothetical protein
MINNKFIVPHIYQHPRSFDVFFAFIWTVDTGLYTEQNANRQNRKEE